LFLADTIKKYSNFVGFPIYLDGACINTIQVLNKLFSFVGTTKKRVQGAAWVPPPPALTVE